jgi:hypothetical protein
MRIYEGSPRQDFEEVFRSIGAFLDQRGMKDVLLLEAPDGFIVQGLVTSGEAGAGEGVGFVGALAVGGVPDSSTPALPAGVSFASMVGREIRSRRRPGRARGAPRHPPR